MTTFGTKPLNRKAAIALATKSVGKLCNAEGVGGMIGFTRRDLKRRNVADLIAGQDTQEICTEGQSMSFQVRSWYLLAGGRVTDAEYRQAGYR
jgi:hypothetical protein